MTSQLPGRPNLDQLKQQAKDLLHSAREKNPSALARFSALPALAGKTAAELASFPVALHDAQSVVAREYGFPSWNALRAGVEELTLSFDAAVKEFVVCATDERPGKAQRLLAFHPEIARANFHTALVRGDAAVAESYLAKTPALATQRGGPRDWEPMLYVCLTRLHRETPGRADGLVSIARRLLALGANPNVTFPWRDDAESPLSALWGASCEARIPELAELLLKAGANPNDGESMFHAAEHGDVPMLDLLHAHGGDANGGAHNRWGNTPLYFILGHTPDSVPANDVRTGVRWLLDHGAEPNRPCTPNGETALHVAARNWDVPMIELLTARGAAIRARRTDGRTPFALAALHGNQAVAEFLRSHDGGDELTGAERFMAACTRGDRAKARAMLHAEPALAVVTSNPQAITLMTKVAARGDIAALETMLGCGFKVDATDGMGATALHWSALHGQLEATRLLLAHGAPVDVRDRTYNAAPLGWNDHGAINVRHPRGDYAGVARALIAAGAPTTWDGPAPGSDEVLEAIAESRRTASENSPGGAHSPSGPGLQGHS